MDFYGCRQIPAAAWQQLRGAKWPRLKKANFAACLARERKLVEGVLICVFLTVCTEYCTYGIYRGKILPVQSLCHSFLGSCCMT